MKAADILTQVNESLGEFKPSCETSILRVSRSLKCIKLDKEIFCRRINEQIPLLTTVCSDQIIFGRSAVVYFDVVKGAAKIARKTCSYSAVLLSHGEHDT